MFLLPDDYWKIRKTKNKGLGVFAQKEIEKGTIIGDYLGKVIKISEYDLNLDKEGLYLMYYSDQAMIYPDRTKPDLHLFNHSCTPNCWMYIYKGHTLFFAVRTILPGEELTISYLLSPKDESCNPCAHICTCGSKFCTGSMHVSKEKYEKWQKFLKKQKKKTRMAAVEFGKNLSKLTSYPKTIPIDPVYNEIIRSIAGKSFVPNV